MSEDAVPKSPFLLMAELDRYFETGVTNRIVNEKERYPFLLKDCLMELAPF